MQRTIRKKSKILRIILLIIIIITILTLIYIGICYFAKKNKFRSLSNQYYEELNFKNDNSDVNYKEKDDFFNFSLIKYPSFKNKNIDQLVLDKVNEIEEKYFNKYNGNNLFSTVANYNFVDYKVNLGVENTLSVVFYCRHISCDNIKNDSVYIINFDNLRGEILKDTFLFIDDYNSKILEYLKEHLSSDENLKNKIKENYIENLDKYKYAISNLGIYVYFDCDTVINKEYGILEILVPFERIGESLNIDESKKNDQIITDETVIQISSSNYLEKNSIMYIKNKCNFYEKDYKNSNLIDTVKKGEEVYVYEICDEKFAKIKFNEKEGYILSGALSSEIVCSEGFVEQKETMYAIQKLNVKSKPNTESEDIGTLNKDDAITKIGRNDSGFSEVIFNEKKAYILSSNLTNVKNSRIIPINIKERQGIDFTKPMVALTFDDGPNPVTSLRIVSTLEKYGAVATFFELGSLMNSYPDVVKKEEAIGCEIGSHTYSHLNLNIVGTSVIKDEIAKCQRIFNNVLGHDFTLIRTPYGNANKNVLDTIDSAIINWNVDTLDWKSKNKDSIINEVRKIENFDGKIVLMHSIYSTTADAVEVIVPELISKGYQLVTVSELFYYKGINMQSGKIYYGAN